MDFLLGTESECGVGGGSVICEEASEVGKALAALEKTILHDIGEEKCQAGSSDSGGAGGVHLVALARLLLGACCEAYLIKKCNRTCRCGLRPHNIAANMKVARLYKDSCHASCWTSAHALYVHDIIHQGINIARPSIHSVKNEFNEPDLSQVYAHRLASKTMLNSDAASMLSLLTRCTNPGSRGWDSSLSTIMEESPATRRVCSDALLVSITGMHSCVHPSYRLHWRDRLALGLHLSEHSLLNSVASLCTSPVALKELIRRLLSNCVSPSFATTHALEHLEHPVAQLAGNLQKLCPSGLELSSMAFVQAGKQVVEARGQVDLDSTIARQTHFESFCTPVNASERNALRWDVGYLGKGSAAIHSKVPAVTVAANLWSTSFRCNFIPFWLHGSMHDIRVARLNQYQFVSIHESNAATKLTLLLSDEEQLGLQRLALSIPTAGLMTLEDVGAVLGLQGIRGTSCNGGTKNSFDTLQTISANGAKGAARLLHFCRAASVSEHLLIYDLGERTRNLQVNAIIKRSLVSEIPEASGMTAEELVEMIPTHTKNLCACVECKRVCNAIACDGGAKWKTSFNEIGSSGSMLATIPEDDTSHLRCAKRSSTSLKTAVACEEEMQFMKVETMDIKESEVKNTLSMNGAALGNGVAARVRRDAKSALEQREFSVPCGCDAMLNIPLLGKAVRLWDNWYGLCSFCGCFMRIYPNNKFEVELCCLRCDYDMLNRNNKMTKAPESSSAPLCRFCGKVDPRRSGARWKFVKSPMDMSGQNAALPPPLRFVHFCPQHFRTWIPTCMKTMQTRVILSHIVFGAKPCYDQTADTAEDEDAQRLVKKPAKKRKRAKK